jgi:hypothetical protein
MYLPATLTTILLSLSLLTTTFAAPIDAGTPWAPGPGPFTCPDVKDYLMCAACWLGVCFKKAWLLVGKWGVRMRKGQGRKAYECWHCGHHGRTWKEYVIKGAAWWVILLSYFLCASCEYQELIFITRWSCSVPLKWCRVESEQIVEVGECHVYMRVKGFPRY